MMSRNVIIQFLMVVLALGIGFTYVKPTFESISEVQNQTAVYQEEILKVSEVNARLASLVSMADSITSSDQAALVRFFPDKVDHISVMKDIELMTQGNGIQLNGLSYEGETDSRTTAAAGAVDEFGILLVSAADIPVIHEFSVSFETTYVQMKSFLATLERNDYVLQVSEMLITPLDGDILTADLSLHAFSRITTRGTETFGN